MSVTMAQALNQALRDALPAQLAEEAWSGRVDALGWPLGRYLAAVMRGAPMRVDRLFGWIERPLYRLLGTGPARGMDWKAYATAFLASNVVLGAIVWVVLMTQAWLPFNPNEAPNMRWDLALHTMVSFLTNTNQQHYSGQAQLSFLSHAMCITGLQVVTPMMGLALVVATLRGLFGGRAPAGDALSASSVAAGARPWMAGQGDPQPAMLRHGGQQPDSMDPRRAMQQSGAADLDVGNYWADVIRPTLRFMLPLCLLWSVLLTGCGVALGALDRLSPSAPRTMRVAAGTGLLLVFAGLIQGISSAAQEFSTTR